VSKATYKSAGVDIDAGNALIDRIKGHAESTKRRGVMSSLGGFAGLFSLGALNKKDPVLVAATDGVGTKLKLALQTGLYQDLGQDLVAMCVNDLICCGAEPLFFLDYYATGKLNIDHADAVIKSIATSLKEINCALLGGETAEMPGMYQKDDFDLAGFSVGVVEKDKIIDGTHVGIGNKIIGISSNGFHSNGYSLVRKIIDDNKLDLNENINEQSLAEHLLKPTTLYVNPVLNLLKMFSLNAMAHITGGGLLENITRVIPSSCQAVIDSAAIKTPDFMLKICEAGNIDENERWRVFNMGIGFVVIVKESEEQGVCDHLASINVSAQTIGTIEKKNDGGSGVKLV